MFVRFSRAMAATFVLLCSLSTVSPVAASNCQFVLGFKEVHEMIPQTVGDCLVDEHHGANGDALQETSGPTGQGGLLVWRKSDNWTAYTDGYHTWVNGPSGLQERLNTERFSWEHDPQTASSPATPTPAQIDVPTQILFTSSRESANDIWVANSDGSSAKRLTFDGQNFGASWSPDKSKIVFESLRDRGSGMLWCINTMNPDGTGATNLTKYSNQDEFDPSWSPDGSRIIFTAKYPDQEWEQIYTERADGTDRQQVTQGPGLKEHPRLSPDGTKIVFRSDLDQDNGIKDPSPTQRGVFVMNSDGTNLHKLTHNAQNNIDPTWSPDGSMIAFVTFKNNETTNYTPNWDITVMNADGGNQHVVKTVLGRTIDYLRNVAAWRGSQLLVQADYDGHWVPKFVNQDGSGATMIGNFELSGADDMASDWR
jgi:TolB protein